MPLEARKGSRDIAVLILGIRWRQERARSWVPPRASLDRHGKDKISCLHWDWNPTPYIL